DIAARRERPAEVKLRMRALVRKIVLLRDGKHAARIAIRCRVIADHLRVDHRDLKALREALRMLERFGEAKAAFSRSGHLRGIAAHRENPSLGPMGTDGGIVPPEDSSHPRVPQRVVSVEAVATHRESRWV